MAGMRFIVAGVILYAYLYFVKGERIVRGSWKPAWIMAALLLLGGNGGVVYAEQFVPSGITALLVGSGPFWFLLLTWLWLKGPRPNVVSIAGLMIGFTGLTILIGPDRVSGATHTPLVPALVVTAAALSWSIGSIYSKTLSLPTSPMMLSAQQMLAGSVLMTGAGLVRGEFDGFALANVSTTSWMAFVYLVIFGSLVGFSAYIYVLRHATPAVASTYAYVNPLVAVFLGWAVAGEVLTSRTIFAAGMIIGAVILISWPRKSAPQVPLAEDEQDSVTAEHG